MKEFSVWVAKETPGCSTGNIALRISVLFVGVKAGGISRFYCLSELFFWCLRHQDIKTKDKGQKTKDKGL
jgi:hypothetical protein